MERVEVILHLGSYLQKLNYPGIFVGIEQEDDSGKMIERQLALVECASDVPTSGTKTLRLLVSAADLEDFTDEIAFFKETKDSIWKEYLRYLHVWADSHVGSDYYGMTPASFDEWVENEYYEN